MPESLTFSSLQSDDRAYLERGTVVDTTVYAQIPRLINMAERRIATELKIQGMQEVVTSTLQSGNNVIDKPDRWRKTISMNLGAGTGLDRRTHVFPRSYEYIRSYWPDDAEIGQPRFYADYDYEHWIIAPTPDQDYPFEVVYYGVPPLLDSQTTTNWLTQYAPSALLYATLLETAPFLKDDERLGVWTTLYDRSISALNGEDLQKVIDRNVARTSS